MRNILKAAAVVMLVAAVAVSSFAASSPARKKTAETTGGGSGSGSGSAAVVTVATGSGAPIQNPVSQAVSPIVGGGAVEGTWTESNGVWRFNANGHQYAGEWVNAVNPYAGGVSEWFYFDAAGNMVTGWQWILGPDGQYYCYYFNPVSNGSKGMAQFGGVTPDGWDVNGFGQWQVSGVAQTK
ncbi:MAG: hypothetical protein IIY96_01245 [Lachnospiraceae bacterium]|nr:hypothetical protein [Lachnospiraceae bacterium]